MVNRDKLLLQTAFWVCAVLLSESQLSYAAAHREPTYSNPDHPPVSDITYCPGCSPRHYVIGLSGGPLFTTAGKTETFFLQPDIEKTYAADRSRRTRASGEVFFGINQVIEPGFRGEIGVAAGIAGSSFKGNIWEDANVEFNDFTYEYSVRNARYAVKGKLLLDSYFDSAVYISGSAGVASNHAHGFTITPIIAEAVPAPSFQPNTELSFSYTLGVGIQRQFSEQLHAGVGYEFADWGQTSLSRAPGQSLNNGLGLSHLYTNEIEFFINYYL